MKKINESFECINCKKKIKPAPKTCRNHCPYCFTSLHVDDKTPWDRSSQCWWIMSPQKYIIKHWEIKVLFVCSKCQKQHRNKTTEDDNISKLIETINTNQPEKYIF